MRASACSLVALRSCAERVGCQGLQRPQAVEQVREAGRRPGAERHSTDTQQKWSGRVKGGDWGRAHSCTTRAAQVQGARRPAKGPGAPRGRRPRLSLLRLSTVTHGECILSPAIKLSPTCNTWRHKTWSFPALQQRARRRLATNEYTEAGASPHTLAAAPPEVTVLPRSATQPTVGRPCRRACSSRPTAARTRQGLLRHAP